MSKIAWERHYNALCLYKLEKGPNADPPNRYMHVSYAAQPLRLGSWCTKQRAEKDKLR